MLNYECGMKIYRTFDRRSIKCVRNTANAWRRNYIYKKQDLQTTSLPELIERRPQLPIITNATGTR